MSVISSAKTLTLFVFVASAALVMAMSDHSIQLTNFWSIDHHVIDDDGPQAPWGKTVGDINGDGLVDLVVGGHARRKLTLAERILNKFGAGISPGPNSKLVWYENPSWTRHIISGAFNVRTDIEVGDINGNGQNDIALVADQGVYWLEAPYWTPHLLHDQKMHDLALADLDADGDLDIVLRNQSLFGYENGDRVLILWHGNENSWRKQSLTVPHGEGLSVADMNGDRYPDIVVNKVWYSNPTGSSKGSWQENFYAEGWAWDDVYIDVADFNNDGYLDIVLTPSEEAGQYYDIAWFEAPIKGEGWIKHIVDSHVEAAHHFVAARDMNNDKIIDIVTAQMNQGEGENPVLLYLGNTEGEWEKIPLGNQGSHSMRAVDIDGDFDIDLFGTNWEFQDYGAKYPVSVWLNNIAPSNKWKRHVIDDNRQGQAIFVYSGDLNGDTRLDITTGNAWYEQPKNISNQWQKKPLGRNANNIAMLKDFDQDDDLDFLASKWRGYNVTPNFWTRIKNRLGIEQYVYGLPGNEFVWGENNGSGQFTIHNNVEAASGDYLQGIDLTNQPMPKILLSFHETNSSLQKLVIPEDPLQDYWQWQDMELVSQSEAVTSVDLDADGDNDIVMGTQWLEKSEGGWKNNTFTNGNKKPDRHVVRDLNNDGKLDVVVGFESPSKPTELVWFQQPDQPHNTWTRHVISFNVVGPMSLDVVDMDRDSDFDVVVGEHNLEKPKMARLMWFENVAGDGTIWRGHLVHRGDEHHNGAHVVDIDGDGDFDIVSIGWSHHKVVLYEQL